MLRGTLYGISASIIWGAWPVVSSLGTRAGLHPTDLTALRFLVAGTLLLPIVIYHRITDFKQWRKGIVLSIGAGAPYVLLAIYGLNHAPSAHFGIIAPSSMLVFTSIGSYFWLKERTTIARIVGTIFIVLGIVIVGGANLINLSTELLRGDLMFVGCGLLWASYTLLCRYWNMNPWLATAQVSVISMMVYIPVYLMTSQSNFSLIALNTLLLQGLFQGVLVAILALFFYSKAISILGSAKGAIFSTLVPPISLVMGHVLMNEKITVIEYIGLAIVCCGMSFALQLVKFPSKRTSQLKACN